MKQILKINTMFAEFKTKNNKYSFLVLAIFFATYFNAAYTSIGAIKSVQNCYTFVSNCSWSNTEAIAFSFSRYLYFHSEMTKNNENYSVGNNSTYSVTPKVSDITTSSIQHLISHLANLPKSSHITINVHTIIGDNNVQKVNS